MTDLCCNVRNALKGFSLVTAESCTGGGIGAALTSIPGSSEVYKGGVICYSNGVKEHVLGVDPDVLNRYGPVSYAVAEQMVIGVKRLLKADAAISVTGLAGPGGDEYGNAVGTVFIGCSFLEVTTVKEYHFSGDRKTVCQKAIKAALDLLLDTV